MPSEIQQGMSFKLFDGRLNDQHTHSLKNSSCVWLKWNRMKEQNTNQKNGRLQLIEEGGNMSAI